MGWFFEKKLQTIYNPENFREGGKMYCPCCLEEYKEGEEFCLDCRLPLILRLPSPVRNHICDCDRYPLGEELTDMLRLTVLYGNSKEAKEMWVDDVSRLTGIIGKETLNEYIQKILKFNDVPEI